VAVGAEADVVSQVEADVVGIFEDRDLVCAPVPIVAVGVVGGEDAEIETAEPEAFAVAAFKAPDVTAAEAAGEMAMLPWMIEMVAGVVGARVVTYPFAVGVDVGGFRMAGFIGKFRSRVNVRPGWRRSLAGNVAVADIFGRRSRMAFVLRESWNGTEKEKCKNCEK